MFIVHMAYFVDRKICCIMRNRIYCVSIERHPVPSAMHEKSSQRITITEEIPIRRYVSVAETYRRAEISSVIMRNRNLRDTLEFLLPI